MLETLQTHLLEHLQTNLSTEPMAFSQDGLCNLW